MPAVPLSAWLVIAVALFAIGLIGVATRRNLLVQLMSVELLLNAANLALVTFSRWHGDAQGQVIAFLVMAVAAGEAAVGLALVLAFFRHRRSVLIDDAATLKH
jgi:NADH-quinone oxidoreductase subunit K